MKKLTFILRYLSLAVFCSQSLLLAFAEPHAHSDGSIHRSKIELERRLEQLMHPDADVRLHAVQLMNVYRHDTAIFIPALVDLLNDDSKEVRTASAVALGKLHAYPEVVAPLIEAVGNEQVPAFVIISALPKFGDVAIEPLIGSLDHKSFAVRRSALIALAALDSKDAIKPVAQMIKKYPNNVERYGKSLSAFGNELLSQLTPLLWNHNPLIATAGANAIAQIDTPEARIAHQRFVTVAPARYAAQLHRTVGAARLPYITALGSLGPAASKSVPALYGSWKGPDEDLLIPAVREALLRINTPEARVVLNTLP